MSSLALRDRIEATAPHRPWCAAEKNTARVLPLDSAITMPYMQLNPPSMAFWLQLDIDRRGAASAWEDALLPPPTYIAINRVNGHAQIGYALADPVCTSEAARMKPLRYLAAVEYAFNHKLGADLAFHGPLAKNPLNERWLLLQPANNPTYELCELADHVDLPSPEDLRRGKINVNYAAYGRNCALFERLRSWAYSAVRKFWKPEGYESFCDHALHVVEALNMQLPIPLPYSEVRSIARSVAKWVWRRLSPDGFREVQAARGRLKGAAKREMLMPIVLGLIGEGKSQREVARIVGVGTMTINGWLKRT